MGFILEDNSLFEKVKEKYEFCFPQTELLTEGQRFEGTLSVEWSWPDIASGTFHARESHWPSNSEIGGGMPGTIARPWTVRGEGEKGERFTSQNAISGQMFADLSETPKWWRNFDFHLGEVTLKETSRETQIHIIPITPLRNVTLPHHRELGTWREKDDGGAMFWVEGETMFVPGIESEWQLTRLSDKKAFLAFKTEANTERVVIHAFELAKLLRFVLGQSIHLGPIFSFEQQELVKIAFHNWSSREQTFTHPAIPLDRPKAVPAEETLSQLWKGYQSKKTSYKLGVAMAYVFQSLGDSSVGVQFIECAVACDSLSHHHLKMTEACSAIISGKHWKEVKAQQKFKALAEDLFVKEPGLNLFLKKIDGLNQLPMSERVRKVLDDYHVVLSAEEEKIWEERNTVIHEGTLIREKSDEGIQEAVLKLGAMQTIATRLILAICGYTGPYVDYGGVGRPVVPSVLEGYAARS